MPGSNSTLLSIDGIEFSDYASRGISMTLELVDSGDLRRDVNGTLRNLTLEQFRKYRISIQCTEHEAPELTGIWKGSEITVTCIPGLGVENTTDETLVLDMMVETFQTERDELEADTAWSLTAVEI